MTRMTPTCSSCGAIGVLIDSYASWDNEKQKWVLYDTYDYAFCGECGEDTKLHWVSEESEEVRNV